MAAPGPARPFPSDVHLATAVSDAWDGALPAQAEDAALAAALPFRDDAERLAVREPASLLPDAVRAERFLVHLWVPQGAQPAAALYKPDAGLFAE